MTRPGDIAVDCDEHGPMVRDDDRCAWYCPAACGTWMPDEELARLAGAAPPDMPGAIRIAVTR